MPIARRAAVAILALSWLAPGFAAEELVRIGVSGPLSGPNAFAGKDNENGVRLAIEELNLKGVQVAGKTVKFALVSEDDGGDPRTGVAVAQKFADARIRFVMGPYNSGVAIPAARVYNDAGILMSTVGTNPKITASGYKGVFRIVASDIQAGAGMAAYAARTLKVKRVGVIDDRTAFGQGIASEFARRARALGIEVAGHEFTNDKASDFAAILTALKSRRVDAIFFGGYAPQAAPMARQMRGLGISARLLGGDTLCSIEMAKLGGAAVGENVLCAQSGALLERLAGGPAFAARYKARFKTAPDVYAASFYDQTRFLAQAMAAANSLEPAAVGAALHAGSYQGVAGTYAYDGAGNMKQSAVTIYTFRNGAPVPLASY
jgi:ABC-type branched-subunit amino acid transport system substrate-binding protein